MWANSFFYNMFEKKEFIKIMVFVFDRKIKYTLVYSFKKNGLYQTNNMFSKYI